MHAPYILSADDLADFSGILLETLHFGGGRSLRSMLQKSYDPKELWTLLFLQKRSFCLVCVCARVAVGVPKGFAQYSGLFLLSGCWTKKVGLKGVRPPELPKPSWSPLCPVLCRVAAPPAWHKCQAAEIPKVIQESEKVISGLRGESPKSRRVPPCAVKSCAVRPVFARGVGDPSKCPRAHEAKC